MNLPLVLVIGVVIGLLEGGSVFFEKTEPYKLEITIAAGLKGVMVSLLTAFTLPQSYPWWGGALIGAGYGLAAGLMVTLQQGGFRSKDAKYILPWSAIGGALNGVLLALFAR